jgi:2-haloacid dehalogenase
MPIRGYVFDAYGTLFDVASAAAAERVALGDRWEPFALLWRAKQLEYTWLRSLMGRHADFALVTADALDFTLEALGIDDPALRARLLALYDRLAAYPDAAQALHRLRGAGLATAILSNGTPAMLASATKSAGLADLLDAVISVEDVRIYKPHRSVYQLAVDRLRVAPGEILFVSSNGWDAYAARAFGFRVAWCNRAGGPPERIPALPDVVVRSLAEVPALVGR